MCSENSDPSLPSTAARRPLKTRGHAWANGLALWLARKRVAPNLISLMSLVFALIGGFAFLAIPGTEGGGRPGLFVLAAVCIQLRLLCNLLDGMVAVEGGLGSRSGEIYNELPDRIADPLLIVPAGYATDFAFGPELGWTAGLLAVMTAYIRVLGASTGLAQDFCGPMAKPHRMAVLTVAALVAAALAAANLGGIVLAIGLVVIAAGALLTAARRTRAIVRALEAR